MCHVPLQAVVIEDVACVCVNSASRLLPRLEEGHELRLSLFLRLLAITIN
jgi:hypothetical protein